MTIRQLEVFLAIAHAQSFSRAAERIHLSQPTLSEHMKELESLLLRIVKPKGNSQSGGFSRSESLTRSLQKSMREHRR